MPSAMPVVVLDPGHGGNQKVGGSSPNNARGPNGLLEKDLTLNIAHRVQARLPHKLRVMLTRERDANLALADRARLARENNAALFFSLHFNGFSDSAVDGTEVWIANQPNQRSRDFATTLLRSVVAVTGVNNRGVKQQDFGVLVPSRHAPETSAALLESAFLTNPTQAQRLMNDAYRDQIAEAIAGAIQQHVRVLTPTTQGMAAAYGSDYGYGGSQSYGNGYSNGYGARSSQPSYALSDVVPDIRGVTDAGQIAQIIAEWTRRKAQFYVGVDNPTFMPFSAICQLGIQLEDGRAGTGTGFYITPNRLLTAGHNILYQGVRATAIEVRPGRAHNMSTFAPFTVQARDFVAHPQYRFGEPSFDMAIIRVPNPPPDGYFHYEELLMSPGSGIVVCGYASGGAQRDQQHMDVDTIRDLYDEWFTYGLHTQGGTSGAPMFYADNGRFIVVGVHHGAQDQYTNKGCRLTEAKLGWLQQQL